MDKFKHILIEYVVPLIAGLIGTLITLAVIKLKNRKNARRNQE